MNNFIDEVTGEEFQVSKVYTKYIKGEVQYFDKHWRIIKSPAGNNAIPITNKIVPIVAVKTKTASRY